MSNNNMTRFQDVLYKHKVYAYNMKQAEKLIVETGGYVKVVRQADTMTLEALIQFIEDQRQVATEVVAMMDELLQCLEEEKRAGRLNPGLISISDADLEFIRTFPEVCGGARAGYVPSA